MNALQDAVGRQDLARAWGLTRQRVAQLTGMDGFPAPAGTINGQPVWLMAECEAWRGSRPGPGRPAKT